MQQFGTFRPTSGLFHIVKKVNNWCLRKHCRLPFQFFRKICWQERSLWMNFYKDNCISFPLSVLANKEIAFLSGHQTNLCYCRKFTIVFLAFFFFLKPWQMDSCMGSFLRHNEHESALSAFSVYLLLFVLYRTEHEKRFAELDILSSSPLFVSCHCSVAMRAPLRKQKWPLYCNRPSFSMHQLQSSSEFRPHVQPPYVASITSRGETLTLPNIYF